jgi:hypothetical protein
MGTKHSVDWITRWASMDRGVPCCHVAMFPRVLCGLTGAMWGCGLVDLTIPSNARQAQPPPSNERLRTRPSPSVGLRKTPWSSPADFRFAPDGGRNVGPYSWSRAAKRRHHIFSLMMEHFSPPGARTPVSGLHEKVHAVCIPRPRSTLKSWPTKVLRVSFETRRRRPCENWPINLGRPIHLFQGQAIHEVPQSAVAPAARPQDG